jgi:hypothetical protein
MSYVTTVVIFGRYVPEEARKMLAVGYKQPDGPTVCFGDLSRYTPAESCDTVSHWCGSKAPESDVFGGAFNFLDPEDLRAWLETVPWFGKVAVVWASQEDEGFQMWTLGEK